MLVNPVIIKEMNIMFKKFTILFVCLLFVGYAKGNEAKTGFGVIDANDCNNITPRFNKDSNNLSGDVNVMIYSNQNMKRIAQVLTLVDGKKYGEFYLFDPCNSPMFSTVQMRTQFFANGPHTVSTVSKDYNFKMVCRSDVNVVFNNELSSVTIDKGYWLGKDFHFSALSSSKSANHIVEVNNVLTDGTVYSGNFTGDINAVIPSEPTFNADSQMYELIVRDSAGNVRFRNLFGRDIGAEEGFKEDEGEPNAIGHP